MVPVLNFSAVQVSVGDDGFIRLGGCSQCPQAICRPDLVPFSIMLFPKGNRPAAAGRLI
jgi:hypothetical protein